MSVNKRQDTYLRKLLNILRQVLVECVLSHTHKVHIKWVTREASLIMLQARFVIVKLYKYKRYEEHIASLVRTFNYLV